MKCNKCHEGNCDEELDFHVGTHYLDSEIDKFLKEVEKQ